MPHSGHKSVLIWSKTDGRCAYCGRQLDPSERWIIEHMTPRSQGGTNRIENLIPSCERCNKMKKYKNVEQFRDFICLGFADDLETKYLERIHYLSITLDDEDYQVLTRKVEDLVESLREYKVTFYFEYEPE